VIGAALGAILAPLGDIGMNYRALMESGGSYSPPHRDRMLRVRHRGTRRYRTSPVVWAKIVQAGIDRREAQ
jgi:hypothetical protein